MLPAHRDRWERLEGPLRAGELARQIGRHVYAALDHQLDRLLEEA